MKLRSAELARRRELLQTRIAAQRLELGRQLSVWRGPIHAFEVARHAGERLRSRAAALIALAGVLLVISRGRVLGKLFLALRWARFAAKWWAFGRMLYRVGGGFVRGGPAAHG
jgi:hypothetical protein